jgi:hypothetical protein
MTSQTHWLVNLTWTVVLLVSGGDAFAQKPAQEKAPASPERDVVIEKHDMMIAVPANPTHIRMPGAGGEIQTGDGNTLIFLSSEMSFDGKTVKGAPYAAQAVTEFTQTLADGNRITRKNNASVYRDSEGRTRRDQTLAAIGPWATAGDPPQTVFINDPVAGVNYILDPRTKTARKLPLPPAVEAPERRPGAADPVSKRRVKGEEVFEEAVPGAGGGVVMYQSSGDDEKAKKESLGRQTIEGVEADGTRFTVTIPAGEIGNEQPMHIVSEQWYSPELQTVVMSRQMDPRSGETIYRLTNVDRAEPARSLFEVPSDYTLKDGEPIIRRFERKKIKGDE